MANEFRINFQMTVLKTPFKDSINPGPILMDQAGVGGGNPGLVNIGITEENISFGDAAPGPVFIQNLDATNYVEYGADDGGVMKKLGKVSPGKIGFIELADGAVLRMKANAAPCLCIVKGYTA